MKTEVCIFNLRGNLTTVRSYAITIAGMAPATCNAYVMAFSQNNEILWVVQAGDDIDDVKAAIKWQGVRRVEIYDHSVDGTYKTEQIYITSQKSLDAYTCERAADEYDVTSNRTAYTVGNWQTVTQDDTDDTKDGATINEGVIIAVFAVDRATVNNISACGSPRSCVRSSLQGVFFDLSTGLSCCCDGHSLNVARMSDVHVIDAIALSNGGVILPCDFVKTAKNCIISIYKTGVCLRAVASNGATCDVMEGVYPDYRYAFPVCDESRPIHLSKSAKELKKTVATVAKMAHEDIIFISGLKGDNYITISVYGNGGEITRRVALSQSLTFCFAAATGAKSLRRINGSSDTMYISAKGQLILTGAKTISTTARCNMTDITTTAYLADSRAVAGNYNYDIISAFAPADSIQAADTGTIEATPAVSSDSVQAADTGTIEATPAVSSGSIQAADTDTIEATPAVSSDSVQAADSDTIDVATAAPADSIQAADSDTIDVATAAPADSIQAADTDTIEATPAVSSDSVQAADTGTIEVTPAVSSDCVQAADSDTINVATAAPAGSTIIIASRKK